MSVVLVTGGTGAVGPELVRRLATARGVERVYVATRTPEGERQRSLLDGWNGLRGAPVALVGSNMQPGARGAGTIASDITHIVHLAADTRFSAPPAESRAANVEGTATVLDLARACPRLSAVAVASTVYVAGLRTGTVLESELEHDAGFANTYEASKHEMERMARAAMRDLPVAVYRLSTVIGEDGSGAVPSLNAFHTAMQLLYAGLIPMVPGFADTPIDVTSTGYVARALGELVLDRFEPGATYHLCAGAAAPSLGDVLGAAMATMRARRPAWRRRSIEMPVLADEPTYALFARSVAESGDAMMIASMRALESFARQLTRPKRFDTAAADAAAPAAANRPDPLALCGEVVGYCVDNQWRAAA